jgi:hypothetical protein
MVPARLQIDAWRTFRPGEDAHQRPSAEFVDVMKAVVNAVASKEGRPLPYPPVP